MSRTFPLFIFWQKATLKYFAWHLFLFLKDLGIISVSRYKEFCIKFGKSGYRKNEPGDYPVNEYSNRFDLLVFKALAEEVISFSKASALSGKSIDTLYQEFNI